VRAAPRPVTFRKVMSRHANTVRFPGRNLLSPVENHMTAFPCKNRPLVMLNLLRSSRLCFVCLVALLIVVPTHAGDQESFNLEAVLALEPGEEMIIISPENIVQVCATALGKKKSLPTKVVAKLFLLRAHAFAALEKFEEAKKDAEEALKLSPDSLSAAILRAQSLDRLEAVAEAQKEMERLAKKNPRSPQCFGAIGQMFLGNGKFDEAIRACSKAIELDPRFPPAYFSRAQARLLKKDCSGCVEDMKRFLELQPLVGPTNQEQEYPYLVLGKAYILLKQNDRALAAYEMAQRLNPASFEAAYGVWESYYQAGRFLMSYAVAPRLIRLDEKDFRAYLAVAASANMIHRNQKAIHAAEQALALNPRLVQAHNQLAGAYGSVEERQYDLAIQEFDRALKIDPNNISALSGEAYVLATCPEKKYRDGPKARELATKACKATEYKDWRTLNSLAVALAECGDFKEAARFQKQALLLLDAKGATAKEEFEKVLELFEKGRPYRCEYEPKLSDDGMVLPGGTEEP
jgi:tetratricopeptide (TPR) repeat protein